MSVKINYSFFPEMPLGTPYGELQLHNPVFAMLSAIREQGSIGRAAATLGVSYRHLWGALKAQEALLGHSLLTGGQGQSARLSEFGERLLWAEKRMLARFLPEAEALAHKLDLELLRAIEPDLELLNAALSHDLLFGIVRDRLRRQAGILLDLEFTGSSEALERLNAGRCAVAGIHLPLHDERLGRRGSSIQAGLGRHLRLGEHKLIRLATREQGLIVERGNPRGVLGLGDLTRQPVVFVNRQAGSGTRLLLDELLSLDNLSPHEIAGYSTEENTHLAVAAAVAAGQASCGFGLRAAAHHFGLDFVPVVEEQYFLVCRKALLDTRPLQSLIEVVGSSNFRRLVATIPGYGTEGSGDVVSLRRTLPWYK